MQVYLINRETNEIERTYTNVVKWASDFVEFTTNGLRGKHYCNTEFEYFSDVEPVVEDLLNEEI